MGLGGMGIDCVRGDDLVMRVHYIIDRQRCLVACFPAHQIGLGLEEHDIVGLLIWLNYAKL